MNSEKIEISAFYNAYAKKCLKAPAEAEKNIDKELSCLL